MTYHAELNELVTKIHAIVTGPVGDQREWGDPRMPADYQSLTTYTMTPSDHAKCVKKMYRDAEGREVQKPVIVGVRRRQ